MKIGSTSIHIASKNNKKVIIKWLIREFLGVILLGVILFVSAGSLNWIMGWSLVIVVLLWVLANALILIPNNPDLIAERIGPKKDSKPWDIILISTIGLISIVKIIIAGLDFRYGWTTEITLPYQLAGLVLALISYSLVIWATMVNTFFSQIVRIQKERGHTVIKNGPYRIMRHPGYLGSILFELSSPILLGSLWALIPSIFTLILFIVRTFLEDKTLVQELNGYKEYTTKVKYRLLPSVW